MEHHTRVSLDRDGEGVRDGVVDRDEFEVERTELLGLPFGHREGVRLDAVFLELRLDEREGQGRADQRDVIAQAKQVGNRANVVFVAVGEDNTHDVLQAVLDRREVRKDQVDAGLSLFGEENSAVDDKNLAVDLIRGHVATDLAESPDGDDSEGTGLELGWSENVNWHLFLFC